MRLRQFTLEKPIPDVLETQERKLDPEVIIKHDNLYARDWGSVFGKLSPGNDRDRPSPPNPREVTVKSDHTNAEMCNTPGTALERFTEFSLQPDGAYDGTDLDHFMEPDAEMRLE